MENKFNLKFIDNNGTFTLDNPDQFKRLYFPLLNESGFISSITPDLKGDIKTGQHTFLNPPVSVEDLYLTKASRNFWALINNKNAWSATGVSHTSNKDKVKMEAGLLYQKIIRENRKLKIRSEITNFVPASGENVEVMHVSLTNLSVKTLNINPFFGMPLFCRSAENLRDHRNVTSMLNRIKLKKNGIVVKPTMLFNESGHKPNNTLYYVGGFSGNGQSPAGFFPTVLDWAGENGDFENPEAVLKNKKPVKNFEQGVEAAAGIKFNQIKLNPNKKYDFVIIMGITKDEKDISKWEKKFNSRSKFENHLETTKKYWINYSEKIKFQVADETFNNWIKWVSIQPLFRKIAGNSFMPDFDYGKGGRGWRDLWQDLLAIILVNPEDVKQSLLNNFKGIRIDGSNATVIGTKHGEFIADRNNVSRVWMDHGVWPFFTLNLYLNQNNDLNILFSKINYFKDLQTKRAHEKDLKWNESDGKELKTKNGTVYKGTILEHVLIQNIIQFFNVGTHNNIKLEDADWNDGLDMANKKGESVAFSAFYAGNFNMIADLLEKIKESKKINSIELFEEIKLLLDTLYKPVSYSSPESKQKRLEEYLEKTKHTISGKTIAVNIDNLIKDLRTKAEWLKDHINKKETVKIKTGDQYFNGYYDNHGKKVEGNIKNMTRMTLTGQVFPLMFGIGDIKKLSKVIKSTNKFLWDSKLKGLRLNSNFKEVKLDLGRAFAFAFGHKENGSFFSHMNVMYGNACYKQKQNKDGYKILNSIYKMWCNHNSSKIYPGIPEYFNNKGRGYYHYLTGSASWYILTMLTEVMGINGYYGDLKLSPGLIKEQFNKNNEVYCFTYFAGKRIKVIYKNPERLEYNKYNIVKILINGKKINFTSTDQSNVIIKRKNFKKLSDKKENIIEAILN